MAECPSVATLNDLLNDGLNEADRAAVLAHVQTCASCQGSLHQLSSDMPGLVQPMMRSALSGEATLRVEQLPAESVGFLTRLKHQLMLGSGGDSEPGSGAQGGVGVPSIEGYEILGEIGRGAVGVVYRARHLKLNRLVALKLIHAAGAFSPEARQRFPIEARAVARLRHPNIVQIYDVGEQNGCPFLSLELVDGENLARRLSRGMLTARESARLMETIARAMEYAHGQGVIHRDLKPANVLLCARGPGRPPAGSDEEPKITDFGLAKMLPGTGGIEEQMTQSGVVLGTPAYTPPEQAKGRVGEIGPTADVYSLGAMLYELLTGQPPFRGASPLETLMLAANAELVSPRRVLPSIPRDLETICLRCLEKDPTRRYQTAGELAEDLSRFLNDEPIRARRVSRVEHVARWARRRPSQTSLIVVALLVVGLLVFGGLKFNAYRQATVRAVEEELREVDGYLHSSAWDQATVALHAAQSRLGSSGPAELRQRLDQACAALDRGRRRDLLVQHFGGIWLKRVMRVEPRFDPAAGERFRNEAADRQYAAALKDNGFGGAEEDAATVASRLGPGVPELVAALDDWRVCAVDRRRRDWLGDVLQRLDHDPWRDRMRAPAVWEDPAAIDRALADKLPEQPISFLISLAERLAQGGKDGAGFLKRIQRMHTSDFLANFALADLLLYESPQQAPTYYRNALAVRPGSVAALNNLGLAQYFNYQLADAKQTYERALLLKPNDAALLNNLGLVIKSAGNYPDAETRFHEAVTSDGGLAEAQYNLGDIEAASGSPGAVAHYQQAVAIDPQFSRAHYGLGIALCARGPIDEARAIIAPRDQRHWGVGIADPIDYFKKALGLDPTWFPTTEDRMRLVDAIREYRKAIESNPSSNLAYAGLGQALLYQGHLGEALEATRQAAELVRQNGPRSDHLDDRERSALTAQLERCQRCIALEARIPSILDGSARPGDASEAVKMAEISFAQEYYAAAARLYREAFTLDSALGGQRKPSYRYRAACAAALAEAAKMGWRRQARDWLRADLGQFASQLDTGNRTEAVRIYLILSHWQRDPALASIRDPQPSAGMSAEEADECRVFWGEVEAMRRRAEGVADQ